MRKVRVIFWVLVASMLVCYSGAYALVDLEVGDLVTFSKGAQSSYIGELVVSGGLVDPFTTFCLERNEYLLTDSTTEFLVDTITNGAVEGGVNGGPFDIISPNTAYLYTMFRAGALAGYDGDGASALGLQWAIWMLEEEVPVNWDVVPIAGLAKAHLFWDAANNSGWVDLGNVRVANLLWTIDYLPYGEVGDPAQSVLVMVPEPASMILLGVGLLGLGGLFRRKRV